MRSRCFIIVKDALRPALACVLFAAAFCGLAASISAQRLAILVPEADEYSIFVGSGIAEELRKTHRVDDLDLSKQSVSSFNADDPFNLYTSEAKAIGELLGTPFFVIVNAGRSRRTSSDIEEYYEVFAAVYVVSSSTGQLIDWKMFSFTGSTPEIAANEFKSRTSDISGQIIAAVEKNVIAHRSLKPFKPFPPVPDEGTPGFEELRPPMPYRRIRPEYTTIANLYSVRASVEAEVDIDENGNVVNIEISRWAGFGLDASVADTIRKMNWRPATVGKHALPMRVLLRYNFTKIDKDEGN